MIWWLEVPKNQHCRCNLKPETSPLNLNTCTLLVQALCPCFIQDKTFHSTFILPVPCSVLDNSITLYEAPKYARGGGDARHKVQIFEGGDFVQRGYLYPPLPPPPLRI